MKRIPIHEIHSDDDIVVALRDLKKGLELDLNGKKIMLAEDVPAKHQIATKDFQVGEKVKMHGVIVGDVTQKIEKGGRIGVHNLRHATAQYRYRSERREWHAPDVSEWENVTFAGFKRPDGGFGTANYWIIIPLVFCENENVRKLKTVFDGALGYERPSSQRYLVDQLVKGLRAGASNDELSRMQSSQTDFTLDSRVFPNVDGLKFLTHEGGCGGTRKDSDALCALFAGYVTHPNVAGATVLSLGCQNAQVSILKDEIQKRDPDFKKPLFVFEQQNSPSEEEMLSEAIRKTFVGLIEADKARRTAAPLSKLTIGMECGGSDGFSGISANPLMGRVADVLVACGGSVVLSEFPEFCGGEQWLLDRCVDETTAYRFIEIYETYAARAKAVGAFFEMNPSPGNIRDGLITDAIKSAGAIKKGGTSPVVDVLDYPFWVTKPGLSLLCTPGGDVESTAIAGAGANLIMFSTGLGTPTGNPIVPVMKISTNSTMARKLSDIIDFDAGPIIDGSETMEALSSSLFRLLISAASGEYLPKAVALGHDEFIPWKRDVSL